jgi:outer membrane receptor protein involved in Fe transport
MIKILLLFFVLCSYTISAQQLIIRVNDSEQAPLTGAVVEMQQEGLTQYGTTDNDGNWSTINIKSGIYKLKITYIGLTPIDTTLLYSPSVIDLVFTMSIDEKLLDVVTVTARRPLLTQDGEKTIVDPTPMIDISTNVLEILEITPGLFVDQDGSVYLGNTTPAAIFINGREQRMGTQDIANLLRSLPPGSIQRIELLRNPSAKYDAASSGGIINIVLKKGVKIGRFGSVNAGFNQGAAGNRFGGISLYNTGSGRSWYINTNYNSDGGLQDLEAQRRSAAPFFLTQIGQTRRSSDNTYLGTGYSQEINAAVTITYDGRLNANLNRSDNQSTNSIFSLSGDFLGTTSNRVDNQTPFISHQHDLGSVIRFDSLGSELDIKLSVAQSFSENNQGYMHQFQDSLFPDQAGEGLIGNRRTFAQGQVDFTYRLPWSLKMETGVKASYLHFINNSAFYILEEGNKIQDSIRDNRYRFSETIAAAYLQFTRPLFAQIQLKGGIRAEFTGMEGLQFLPADNSFTVNRLDWFPYVFLSRKLMKIAGYELRAFAIYRRTLNRPGYQSLNPAIRILDQFNYEAGNPALNPQFTDNIELNFSVDDYPIFALGRNETKGIISSVLYNDPENPALTFNTFDNIGQSRETYFRIVAAVPPGAGFFAVAGAQYNWNEYQGFYEGTPVNFQRGSWRIFTYQSLNITKSTKFSFNAFMLINGQMNFLELGNFGQANLTLSQTLMQKKLNLSFFVRDVFRTMNTPFLLRQGDILFEGSRYADNQRVGMNLRYNFGMKPKEERRKGNLFQLDD